MNLNRPLILASKSPRRQQLLEEAGFRFQVKTVEICESYPQELDIHQVAIYLARKKVESFIPHLDNEIVITADTVVIIGDQIIGKPKDANDAAEMLRMLSGSKHQVTTGVCIATKEELECFDDTTDVYFKELSDDEIHYYISEYNPLDKAGAYGIQEWIGMIGIKRIEGSYFNVVGLPIQKIYHYLQKYS